MPRAKKTVVPEEPATSAALEASESEQTAAVEDVVSTEKENKESVDTVSASEEPSDEPVEESLDPLDEPPAEDPVIAESDDGEAPLLISDSDESDEVEDADTEGDSTVSDEDDANDDSGEPAPATEAPPTKPVRRQKKSGEDIKTKPITEAFDKPPGNDLVLRNAPVLTIESREVIKTDEDKAEELWHNIQNARRTRRILTGTLVGLEMTEAKKLIAIVYYHDQRVVIPMSELLPYDVEETSVTGSSKLERLSKIANNMLGCDIDFIVAGIDKRSRSIVASRKAAMLKKRHRFYMITGDYGLPQVHEGRTVQARIVSVSAYNIRVDIFGVETVIPNQDLSWEWLANASEKYSVGEKILVNINRVDGNTIDTLRVKADVRSLTPNNVRENLLKVSVQGKYMGTINNINHGVIYLRLKNGVNAVAHTCLDRRDPGVNDEVAFVVTGINWDHNDAEGLITKIIRQNI